MPFAFGVLWKMNGFVHVWDCERGGGKTSGVNPMF